MERKTLIVCLTAALIALAPPAFAEDIVDAKPYALIVTPSFGGGLILPIGVFTDLTDIGGGAEIGAQMRNVFFENATLKLLIGYQFVAEHIETVDSFGVSSLTLLAGYTFNLSPNFRITPLLGFGYVGHVVGATETAVYLDPDLRLEVDLALGLFDNFSLFVSPYFTVFFEETNIGLYAGLNLGAALSFNIPVASGPATRVDFLRLTYDLNAFSPNADGVQDVIAFTPQAAGTFDRFELVIRDGGRRGVKVLRGAGALPASWVWDGKKDDGKTAADGVYTAELALSFSGGEKKASTGPFTLDTVPPDAALEVAPKRFSPDGDGAVDTADIRLAMKNPQELGLWSLKILDPAGNLFFERRESDAAVTSFAWNGRSAAGELVQSAAEYPVEAAVRDAAGNAVVCRGVIATDILIQRFGSRMKMIIPSIVFEGFNADFRQGKPEQVAKNLEILDRLAEIFKQYTGYRLVVEGYAINVYSDPARRAKENREALLPLSRQRAESIRQALIERGFRADKIKAEGRGNADPIVPYGDKANQWKNRRVEFILEK